MINLQLTDLELETNFMSFLKMLGYSEFTPSDNKSTVYDYSKRIKNVCEWENTTWEELAFNIKKTIIKYDIGGDEEKYGMKSKRSVINALKRYREFVESNNISTYRNYIIVDQYSGSRNLNYIGHEIFNEERNPIDGRFYAYVPDSDNPNIRNFGVGNNVEFIDDVLVIFVRKKEKSNNRIITGYYPQARIHRKKILDSSLDRRFTDKDGTEKTATYSIESNDYTKVPLESTYEINTKNINPSMFRKQRVYSGKYSKLDKEIVKFIGLFEINNDYDDDNFDFQESIQSIDEATNVVVDKAPKQEVKIDKTNQGLSVRRNPKLAKTAIKKVDYLCEFDVQHTTFINKNNNPYMEGHHLIPCTVKNATDIWDKFGTNIDCVENIISLCPNCHREIHFGNNQSKKKLLTKLYNHQYNKLMSVDIKITIDELYDYYGVL